MSTPKHTLSVARESKHYATLRSRFFNARLPQQYPAVIVLPLTTNDVVDAMQKAVQRGQSIGVRSGGHLFPACSLINDGLLIDTKNLNKSFEYDVGTKIMSFGPGLLSREMSEELDKINRFFPFGHSPTVGIGGFLLCGGQGWFMRGWGCTSDTWIVKIEVAARGSGQGFFGVMTRIWGRTMPTRELFESTLVFQAASSWEKIAKWVFDTNDKTPRYGIADASLLVVVSNIAYADSKDEAITMLRGYTEIPGELRELLVTDVPIHTTTWTQLFADQDALNPTGNGERWQCDSIFNNPSLDRDELLKVIKPSQCELPSRRSIGCIYIAEYYPDAADSALSLPQQYYISTMACWSNPDWDTPMRQWMYNQYSRVSEAGVMSDENLVKWMKIRRKYDPKEIFPGFRGFSSILETKSNL
ncbi:hypothetical protein EDB80DRAFT_753848 [Ilyonectria destructans]|nr:hypothetical protein EDB80DRAFT_753848 [Ilyonectria destructans]